MAEPSRGKRLELKKRTLTNLCNAMLMWLELAHKKLDEAVLEAYGWPRETGDEEILGGCWRESGKGKGRGGR